MYKNINVHNNDDAGRVVLKYHRLEVMYTKINNSFLEDDWNVVRLFECCWV